MSLAFVGKRWHQEGLAALGPESIRIDQWGKEWVLWGEGLPCKRGSEDGGEQEGVICRDKKVFREVCYYRLGPLSCCLSLLTCIPHFV